jgi:hypothetical protein
MYNTSHSNQSVSVCSCNKCIKTAQVLDVQQQPTKPCLAKPIPNSYTPTCPRKHSTQPHTCTLSVV